jgi:hypothetical protein
MTLDGEEIGSFSDASWWRQLSVRRKDLGESWEEAESALQQHGALSRNDFYEALYLYLGAAISESIESDHPIVRGLAMLDRRLGKRGLRKLNLRKNEHPFVRYLFAVRCEAEGLRSDDA